ncbi:MAG TPA: hypothetical protein D7I07_06925 [Candidatus Poseidoniales archaeon]|nr:MAG TPA: hypothetical protein D7I07_06925 [Candidatus Poseidoniales archaeon]
MNVVIMQQPKIVLRKALPDSQLSYLQSNLLNLDLWPMWNQFASRILSENHGILLPNQRIDLHRVVAQQLIEDMWSIAKIEHGENPEFCQLVLQWHGQTINGRTSALAIKQLVVDITIVYGVNGGVEVSAWWEVSRLSKLLGFGNKIARQLVKQIYEDLTNNGIVGYQPTESERQKSVAN